MNAMILGAGLGTRLRPWTLHHPKALVPVEGRPMLERVIGRLREEGFGRIVVNVHHFAGQIKDFLAGRDFGVEILVSDESGELLDTGGGIAAAAPLLAGEPFLVHNVDILSDAPLGEVMRRREESGSDILLLTSARESSRHLLFRDGRLRGWTNRTSGEMRLAPEEDGAGLEGHAFSGIYAMGPEALEDICSYGRRKDVRKFPVMDYFLSFPEGVRADEFYYPELRLIDIGKPASLARAGEFLGELSR